MTAVTPPKAMMQSSPCGALAGNVSVPGDKSISHRALMLASQALGATTIYGLLEGEDVIHTYKALSRMGVKISCKKPQHWNVQGVGAGGLSEASDVLDMGNSGTGARLMMGLVTPYPFVSIFTGDESLRSRPMMRVIAPLEQMGAVIQARAGNKLPLALQGVADAIPITYDLPVPSAQVKSAILFAALNTRGVTTVTERVATRDHTERMLRYFGWQVETHKSVSGGISVTLQGQQVITPMDRSLTIPGDPSSAAFLTVATLIVPGSDITITGVCINPLRTGLYNTLREMGADIVFTNTISSAGEEVADIRVRHSKLKGISVPAERAPSMIDEYPALAIAAAFAAGNTVMNGLAELRVKESDRLSAIAAGLKACGVECEINGDVLTVTGSEKPRGRGTVVTHMDHRIAMSFLVLGMGATEPVHIDDGSAIATSFPGFAELMNQIGARIVIHTPASVPVLNQPLTIAVDGPASSGKGTLARRLAEHFKIPYLDTGSIYRAVGLKLIYSDKNPFDKRAAIDAALALTEQDLSNPRLRQERIGQAASIISAIPEVRAILLDFQRRFAANASGGALDGRDIGTVVCPDAMVKIFITATLDTRAKRRHRELQGEGIEVVYESVLEDLKERDERDAKRAVAPLVPAQDAYLIDTSHLDANDVFVQVVQLINDRLATKPVNQ